MVKGKNKFKTLIEGSGRLGYASWFVCLKYVSIRQNSTKSPLTGLSNYLACRQIKKTTVCCGFTVQLWFLRDVLKSGRLRINDFIYCLILLYYIQYIKSVKSLARERLLFDHPSHIIITMTTCAEGFVNHCSNDASRRSDFN